MFCFYVSCNPAAFRIDGNNAYIQSWHGFTKLVSWVILPWSASVQLTLGESIVREGLELSRKLGEKN